MGSNGQFALGAIVLGSVLFVSSSCDHGTISSGAEGLYMTYAPSPSGSGRYDRAEFEIRRIQALPADPALAALYGSERLEFRFSTFIAKLDTTQEVAFADIALAAGTYNITSIEITPPSLVDTNVALNPPRCIDGVAVLNGAPLFVPDLFSFPNPAGLTFTVQPGQTRLALTVNVPGLIAGYENAFTCQVGCGSGGTNCVTAFNEQTFRAAFQANVTIE